jgi:hypothetical protein
MSKLINKHESYFLPKRLASLAFNADDAAAAGAALRMPNSLRRANSSPNDLP